VAIYFTTIASIFVILLCGILADRVYRTFAARHPQLGPFRDNSKCGCCKGGSGCSDTSCNTSQR
jgi:hypothetical protein